MTNIALFPPHKHLILPQTVESPKNDWWKQTLGIAANNISRDTDCITVSLNSTRPTTKIDLLVRKYNKKILDVHLPASKCHTWINVQ